MNPKPLVVLNHLTVPVDIGNSLELYINYLCTEAISIHYGFRSKLGGISFVKSADCTGKKVT
ncbi:hypothetical protein BHOIPH791_11560 [Bartonella henselae]|nr:hypothetical protein BH623125_02030 [Bartonella henselae]GFF04174.1 hypothetical protein BH80429_09950 [Bartonella henselae]